MMTFIKLFYEFLKTGLFSIGGGLATLPFLKDMAQKYPWFTSHQLTDMIAISESTPGPIGVNMATYAGFKAGITEGGILSGLFGSFTATFALVLPSVIVIIIISKILEKFRKSKTVDDAFYGLRPASAGLILGAMLDVFISALFFGDKLDEIINVFDIVNIFNFKAIILFLVSFILIMKLKKVHPILFILGGCIFGIVFR